MDGHARRVERRVRIWISQQKYDQRQAARRSAGTRSRAAAAQETPNKFKR